MKKVGIIDAYISNFHANTYFKLFHEIAVEQNREEYIISHVYARMDESPSTKETTAQWCEKTGAKACETIKEVCDSVDVIMVLAPNNPELHEEFCKLPFESGKPVYVDKTFAPDYETAKRIIDMGKANNINFWSSSATRFESSMATYLKEGRNVKNLSVISGFPFEIYSIHQIELANTFMGNGAISVVCTNPSPMLKFEITYSDNRKVFLNQFEGNGATFLCFPEIDGKCLCVGFVDDFWKNFVCALLDFFDNGKAPVPVENTLECIAIRSAMIKAKESLNKEIMVESI